MTPLATPMPIVLPHTLHHGVRMVFDQAATQPSTDAPHCLTYIPPYMLMSSARFGDLLCDMPRTNHIFVMSPYATPILHGHHEMQKGSWKVR